MFGLEYIIAAIKIFCNIGFAIVTAIPAVIAWNCIAPVYLTFMPEVYLTIPYWHMVSILLVFTFVGEQVSKLVPTLVKVEQTNNK